MPLESINPATGALIERFTPHTGSELDTRIERAVEARRAWSALGTEGRAQHLRTLAARLRHESEALARLMCEEMGKRITEARAEIEKCAWCCDHYAEHGPAMLADEVIASDAGRSYVRAEPLGVVLAIMPWNFPFWQLIRAAAPTLLAGNALLLKHASNVTRCALTLETLFVDSGFPPGLVAALLIEGRDVAPLIGDARIRAVTLTGSTAAGRVIASACGQHLKKCVLELGGADPFIVLEDADLEHAAQEAIAARFQNAGQSCIAAKRFIVVEAVADDFSVRFAERIAALRLGDPLDEQTTLGPLAREDLRTTLAAQVEALCAAGARPRGGVPRPCAGPGWFYPAVLLDLLPAEFAASREELFGPVACLFRVPDAEAALALANRSPYGLGGSVWGADIAHAEALAGRLDTGMAFVNGMVKSDPRLPFGGVKDSGYGRELSHHGLREFLNLKTVWLRGSL
jgi:succinate-semialdehyde dehydrogenase/glutarate-semialdehyde dehydrogenase